MISCLGQCLKEFLEIVENFIVPLTSYKFNEYAPILSPTHRLDIYADILIPTDNCWQITTQRFFPTRCENSYLDNEFNNKYRKAFEEHDMIFSGLSPDENLVEIIELLDHPFFVGCQFHPEIQSRPMEAHPLFRELIRAALSFREHTDI